MSAASDDCTDSKSQTDVPVEPYSSVRKDCIMDSGEWSAAKIECS